MPERGKKTKSYDPEKAWPSNKKILSGINDLFFFNSVVPPVDGVAMDVSVHEGVEAHAQHDDVEGVQQPDVDHLQRQQYYH
jgi:hypothetical protein